MIFEGSTLYFFKNAAYRFNFTPSCNGLKCSETTALSPDEEL